MSRLLLTLFLGLALCGCREEKSAVSSALLPPGTAPLAQSLEQDMEESNALKTVLSHPVELGKNTHSQPFFVANRTEKMTQFACSNCHEEPLPERTEGLSRHPFMHVDIELQHASAEAMDCRTCHNEQKMDTLKLNDGTEVSFNHAYKTCMQCHFQQGEDWIGGAHGKRLDSWRGKRVVMNCTECHNPHKPAFEQRFPKGRPTIPRTGGTHH
jgi:hypothetical protein